MRALDPKAKVGSRHHVVPRFLLERWADSRGLVQVRSKVDGSLGTRNVKDMGITDFYTFISVTGELDASLEEIFSVVEGDAAKTIRGLMNPFSPVQQMSPEQAATLANFLALQMARGPRRRREFEIMADWYGKTMIAAARSILKRISA